MMQRGLFDPCARKHQGNPESEAAFNRANITHDRAEVLRVIRAAGLHGATSKEVARAMEKALNCISGRFVGLLREGLIYRTEEKRDGAAVWRSL